MNRLIGLGLWVAAVAPCASWGGPETLTAEQIGKCKADISAAQKKYEVEESLFLKRKPGVQNKLRGYVSKQVEALKALKGFFSAEDIEKIRAGVSHLKTPPNGKDADRLLEQAGFELISLIDDRLDSPVREKKWTFSGMVCDKSGKVMTTYPGPVLGGAFPRSLAEIKDSRTAEDHAWGAVKNLTQQDACPVEQPKEGSADSVLLTYYVKSPIYTQGATWVYDGKTVHLIVGTYDARMKPPFLVVSSMDLLDPTAKIEGGDLESALHQRFARSNDDGIPPMTATAPPISNSTSIGNAPSISASKARRRKTRTLRSLPRV